MFNWGQSFSRLIIMFNWTQKKFWTYHHAQMGPLRAFAYTAQPITLINTTCSFLFLFISRFLCGSLNNPWTSCWRRAWGEKWTFLFETICWNTTRNVSHVPYLSTVMGVTGSFPLQRSAWKHSFIKASWLEHDPEPHINTKLGLILLTLIVLNTWMFFSFSSKIYIV